MKLSDHTEHIRKLIDTAFRNRLGRMGIDGERLANINSIPKEYHSERKQIEIIREVLIAETGSVAEAYEKLVEEFTFTLFNRLAAIKVMEAHTLHPEIVTRRTQHGDRSFAHKHWLEQYPDSRNEEMEGLVHFIEYELNALSTDIPLFSLEHPYHLLPTAFELNNIINAFNKVEADSQVEDDIWQSDDVLGWLYESYNIFKKELHDDSGLKTEYNKVSIQSQYYTPSWVVKFLVDNSLGKLYLEMYPDSDIKNRYKIANVPIVRTREVKPLTDIRVIDPATGSGNFLLYAFDLFYDLYTDQIDNYGADYDDRKIAELIIANNLHGIDLDDRAIQLAQLGLYIKAKRKKRSIKIEHFNIVSSDFFLPDFKVIKSIFEENSELGERERKIIAELWEDLQNAYKFGALVRLEEKMSLKWFGSKINDKANQITLFGQENLNDFENFREKFFKNLQKAVIQNTDRQGQSFLNTKTQDAITFLQLLTQNYDVAVANPPYTDSSDFGAELKLFIDSNYKNPLKFNANLYVTFIKRCFELVTHNGFIAMINPYSFMYIKTFEDVRRLILEQTHIDLLVDFGLDRVNLFDGGYASAPTFFILSKRKSYEKSAFFKLNHGLQEKEKKLAFETSFQDYLIGRISNRVFLLEQESLKIIKGWPFIYWISEGFREKFKQKSIEDVLQVRQGIATGNNDRCLRYWWEIENEQISNEIGDSKKWKIYSKGGPFKKWYGNFWTVIDFSKEGYNFLLNNGNHLPSKNFYFKEGITYSALGSGISFRSMPENRLFDVGGSCVFMGEYSNVNYSLAFLNSKLAFYIAECLNPTVNTQVGDLKRIPFVKPSKSFEDVISMLTAENILILQKLNSYSLIELNFEETPLFKYKQNILTDRVVEFLNDENFEMSKILINEAIINQLILEVYEVQKEDRLLVESKMGLPVAELPILNEAKKFFIDKINSDDNILKEYLNGINEITFEEVQIEAIKSNLLTLYQTNNNLEEFCIYHQLNPINVWYFFKVGKIRPLGRTSNITIEFLGNAFRTILIEDQDGIVPLAGLPGEPRLMDRLEQFLFKNGFNSAQIMQLDALIGRPINDYLENYFFTDFCNHLNLFMYLPKAPFIWHLSSGVHQGFEAYTIIYKWNRDSLYKLKSNYLSNRIESLQYRLQQIADNSTGQAQTEKETIRLQLQEIETFTKKIDELIAEGYDPKLDDGVGKNIAPLQAKEMLRAEVLKASGKNSQLQKYLNADW